MNFKKELKIGDTIARLTKALGIPHCEKCEKRRLILNEINKLGIKETLKKLKTTGGSVSETEDVQRLEDLKAKLADCCKK